MAGTRDGGDWQAGVTFAMARHAVVDLARVFHLDPRAPFPDRLSASDLVRIFHLLSDAGQAPSDSKEMARRLSDLRRTYEPYVNALADRFLMPLPAWVFPEPVKETASTA